MMNSDPALLCLLWLLLKSPILLEIEEHQQECEDRAKSLGSWTLKHLSAFDQLALTQTQPVSLRFQCVCPSVV